MQDLVEPEHSSSGLLVLEDKRAGERWKILQVNRTSDGFLIASAMLVDDSGVELSDDSGFPVIKSIFLGR